MELLVPATDDVGKADDAVRVLLKSWRLRFDSDGDNYKSIITSGTMEALHGVDVSWIHKPKDHDQRKAASSTSTATATATSTPTSGAARDIKRPRSRAGTIEAASPVASPANNSSSSSSYGSKHAHSHAHSHFPGAVTPPSLSEATREPVTALPAPPTPPSTNPGKAQSKRPGLLSRSSSEKLNGDSKGMPRRSSWISNISSKFSSTSESPTGSSAVSPAAAGDRDSGAAPTESEEDAASYTSSSSKGSSFFSNLTRKLSAGQAGSSPRVSGKGGVCQRRVLNVDPNRPRCLVPELDPARLRKVSFCVDVEIAGGPRYKDDEDEDQDRKQKKKDVKIKERAEGEALKHPEDRDEDKIAQDDATKTKPLPIPNSRPNVGEREDSLSPPIGSVEGPSSVEGPASVDKKKEKKKRSEEERKERKEKRRRRAEENGTIPVEVPMDGDAESTSPGSVASSLPGRKHASSRAADANRPTTDPVRIYRRCCQLRETPILKRITEQLMSPTCCVALEPGVVQVLDLTGSRLQLADMITLGDWLAVVPVKKLLLEDADLSDEGLRCILAGLLAAKRPEPTKRRSTSPRHRMVAQPKPRPERSGIVEKLHLKNNPRLTRIGWKHISLFLYACRSIKAIDLSMIQFPATLPPSGQSSHAKTSQNGPKVPDQETDAAETFLKCLSQRSGGNKLEELIMSECGMSAPQIRKIVDGAIMCGVNRLGFAGNRLDDQGLQSVLHYLRSGVCGALDIGGNDLRDKLGLIAEALESRTGDKSYWGLSLAGCNLDTKSVKPLFPVLVKLPNFRFIDLSHNPDLCSNDNGTISLLRRYIGQMKCLKRIHLSDVGMSAKQAIALADVLPEGPQLAHFNILENAQLSALASAKDEESQEEACALYASYMAAVRVSNTLICIDIDVPSSDNSEIVKALAKQVVAYSLRNMEHFALAEVTGAPSSATADAAASLTAAHGGEQHLKEIAYPDVLMHLVGHVEGNPENQDEDDTAPDDDYIVGGTGLVKALQYVLGEKADDVRRGSVPASQGSRTPRERPGSSAGVDAEQRGKAKKMSKNLLDSARKIRARLQPALQKVAASGDELAYRRLNFLDETLQSMIQRFEEEYPETRLISPSPAPLSLASSAAEHAAPLTITTTRGTEITHKSDDEDEYDESVRPAFSRHNSDVSLASRALSMEEGHLHRLGQRMRRSVVDSPVAVAAVEEEQVHSPWAAKEEVRMKALKERLEGISGPDLKDLVSTNGWDFALQQIGANLNDLRTLQEEDPVGWEQFKDSQLKARMNVSQDARIGSSK